MGRGWGSHISWSRPGGGETGHVFMPWSQSGRMQYEENKKNISWSNVLTAVKSFGLLISVLKSRTSDVVPPFESGPEATGLSVPSAARALPFAAS
jgi:hypothetical protein